MPPRQPAAATSSPPSSRSSPQQPTARGSATGARSHAAGKGASGPRSHSASAARRLVHHLQQRSRGTQRSRWRNFSRRQQQHSIFSRCLICQHPTAAASATSSAQQVERQQARLAHHGSARPASASRCFSWRSRPHQQPATGA